ncbi:extracellular solute-binding protein [Schaalia sp. 19OD2882]|uniref:extracellular solute-binding protein n=1 Tax=Schaalia sp. 19OD2882 TaxID=2794089 RepID=UPI001C1F0873|nr:extracellular solute-binding protein [Schaalia sp. 19OD2882]QWW19993.1 extracellular solute-binding protein [Schaalia sp. 19OD2882]
MTRGRPLVALVAAGAMIFGLAACTGGGPTTSTETPASAAASGEVAGEITFQTWSLKNEKFTPYFEKLIAEFEKENPKVKVKWLDQPGEGYEEKLLQQANAGELPDVVNVPPQFGYQLAKTGQLLDLRAADSAVLKDYVEGGLAAYQYTDAGLEGSYGYPWYLGTMFNYWNMDALAKAGITEIPTDEASYYAAAEKAGAKGVALLHSVPSIGTFAARGIPVWDADKREFVFNTDEAVKLVERYADLYAKGALPPELITASDNGAAKNEAYYKGVLGNIQSTPSFVGAIADNAPSLTDKTKVTNPWETPQLLVQGISVSAKSKAPAAALAFAKYVTNNENQVAFVKIAKGFLPGTVEGNKNAADFASAEDSALMKEALKVAGDTVQKAELLGPLEVSNQMETIIVQQVSAAITGQRSAKEALDTAVQQCNQLVTK